MGFLDKLSIRISGYDRKGYDILGYDREGYDNTGFDYKGYDRDGFNQEGYDRDGYDRKGFNRKGFDKNGYNRKGFDRKGFNREGRDRSHCAASSGLTVARSVSPGMGSMPEQNGQPKPLNRLVGRAFHVCPHSLLLTATFVFAPRYSPSKS